MLHNLMLFAGVLRGLGLDVGSGNVLDLVRATEYAPIGRKQDFHQAARCLLVHRKQDLPLFDEAFQVFWRKPASGQATHDLRSLGEQRRYRKPQLGPPPGSDPEGDGSTGPDGDDQSTDRIDLTRTYSAREVLREKDFATFSPVEIVDARVMMAKLAWDLGRRRTRRRRLGEAVERCVTQTDVEVRGRDARVVRDIGGVEGRARIIGVGLHPTQKGESRPRKQKTKDQGLPNPSVYPFHFEGH